MKLVGIAGKAGAGKDTVADMLWVDHDFSKFSFAYPLKLCVAATFGIGMKKLDDREFKEVDHPKWGLSPRRMMQRMGDAVRREFGEDIFVRHLELLMDTAHDDDIVISDVRFKEEAEMIRKRGGVIIQLDREGAGTVAHRSEDGLPADLIDHVVRNDGTKDALYLEIERILDLPITRLGEDCVRYDSVDGVSE